MFPLRVVDIIINIKSKRLIGPINLQIEQNGISILLGSNGSGKTTLLEALHGLRKLSAGKVEWAISQTLAAKEQTFVFQSPIMFRRTVAENLALPLKVRRLSKLPTTTEVMMWAKKIGLEDKIKQQAMLLLSLNYLLSFIFSILSQSKGVQKVKKNSLFYVSLQQHE